MIETVLEPAEQVQPRLNPVGRFQPAPDKELRQGLVRLAAGKKTSGKMMDQLHGLQAVEPAVEGGHQGALTWMVAAQFIPYLGKTIDLKKLCQTGGYPGGTVEQGGTINVRALGC